jgi:mitochondrial fission protein ELM1
VKNLLSKNYALMITTSRRTPKFVKSDYQKLAGKNESIWYFDGAGENPYFAFLNAADLILVTEDSTNMLTESCTTGKPVFTLPMATKSSKARKNLGGNKFLRLLKQIETRCFVSPFATETTSPHYKPLDETTRIAHEILTHSQYFHK